MSFDEIFDLTAVVYFGFDNMLMSYVIKKTKTKHRIYRTPISYVHILVRVLLELSGREDVTTNNLYSLGGEAGY